MDKKFMSQNYYNFFLKFKQKQESSRWFKIQNYKIKNEVHGLK